MNVFMYFFLRDAVKNIYKYTEELNLSNTNKPFQILQLKLYYIYLIAIHHLLILYAFQVADVSTLHA